MRPPIPPRPSRAKRSVSLLEKGDDENEHGIGDGHTGESSSANQDKVNTEKVEQDAMVTVILRAKAAGVEKPEKQQESLKQLEENVREREDLLFEKWNGQAGDAVPLTLRRKEVTLQVKQKTLEKTPYFLRLLAPGGAWSSTVAKDGSAVLDFPTLRMLDGFLTAMQCLVCPSEHPVRFAHITLGNALQVHAASCLLDFEPLTLRAEDFLSRRMCVSLFFRAFTASERFSRTELKKRLFRWLCYSGRLQPWLKDPSVRARALCVSLDKKHIACGNTKSIAAAQFYAAMRFSLKEKRPFFSPGDPRPNPPKPYTPTAAKGDHEYQDVIQCYIERRRFQGVDEDETHFVVRSEADASVLLAFCHITGSSEVTFSSAYPSKFTKDSQDYVGCLESSFTGTTFVTYDCGVSVDDPITTLFPEMSQGEHAALVYDSNVMGRIPNAMTAIVPDLSRNEPLVGPGGLVDRFERNQTNGLLLLRTRKPSWNTSTNSWTLDFHGRVKIASKKNFKIMNSIDEHNGEWLMLFGKVSKHRFSLDFRPPLSIMQVASIAASAFCDKLMVT